MSVSVHLTAVLEPTADYLAKRKAYMACTAAGVEPPAELCEYFDDVASPPIDAREVSLAWGDYKDSVSGAAECGEGAVIDLSKLPEGTKYIRVHMG